METQDMNKAQGHWVLAKMGKRVLRPGGKQLTERMIGALEISPDDDIAEFAPGMGFTASLALEHHPRSYIGIDADADAVAALKQKFRGGNVRFQLGSAADTNLEAGKLDKVYGEAMLTMHADHRKAEIVREACRILKKGGLYAIHELGLTSENEELNTRIRKELATSIKVNARPLSEAEWTELLENEGFKVRQVFKGEMLLLEPKRVVDDEGLPRALRIAFNVLTYSDARKRIGEMRKVFRRYRDQMNAVALIAEKV